MRKPTEGVVSSVGVGGREKERSSGMSNDEFIVVRGSSEKPRKITVSFLLFISFLSHLFLVFS